ncbi:hypothetical protein [Leptodesmis sp.]|uniref:hypothetical protein n=1 Tax=Leptodesmis sp. TaxID=3100501 RepID=UPI0040534B30
MKRLLTWLAGLMMVSTSGCVYAWWTDAPTRVIHQHVACPTTGKKAAQRFQVLGTYHWTKGVIVLYSAMCPTQDGKALTQRVFGHQVMKRQGMGWQVSSGDSFGMENSSKATDQKTAEQLIDYGVSHSKLEASDRYLIVYGQILNSKVGSVEVTFNNGQVLRDSGSDGAFALVAPGATGICELRILGTNNQILRKDELASPKPDSTNLPNRLVKDLSDSFPCLPTSRQL